MTRNTLLVLLMLLSRLAVVPAPSRAPASAPDAFKGHLIVDDHNSQAQASYTPALSLSPDHDYTVEVWLEDPYFTAFTPVILSQKDGFGLAFFLVMHTDGSGLYDYNLIYASQSCSADTGAQAPAVSGCAAAVVTLAACSTMESCRPTGRHHLAAVHSALDHQVTLYWDGVRRATSADIPALSSQPFKLGGARGIDELRISSTARYGGAAFPPPSAPFSCDAATLGLWHFNEYAGSTVYVEACSGAGTFTNISGTHTSGGQFERVFIPIVRQ